MFKYLIASEPIGEGYQGDVRGRGSVSSYVLNYGNSVTPKGVWNNSAPLRYPYLKIIKHVYILSLGVRPLNPIVPTV